METILGMLVCGLFAVGAGMVPAALVLSMARRAEPQPNAAAYWDNRTEAQRHAEATAAVEAEHNHVGTWHTINGMECYIVPQQDIWSQDGELVEDFFTDDKRYVLGDFVSHRPFTVAAIRNEFGVSRRPWGGFPSSWFWSDL